MYWKIPCLPQVSKCQKKVSQGESNCKKSLKKFILRTELNIYIYSI